VTDSRENSAHPDLTGYIFGLAGGEDPQAVRAHLQQCKTCAREVQEMSALPDLMGAAAPAAGPFASPLPRIEIRLPGATGICGTWPAVFTTAPGVITGRLWLAPKPPVT